MDSNADKDSDSYDLVQSIFKIKVKRHTSIERRELLRLRCVSTEIRFWFRLRHRNWSVLVSFTAVIIKHSFGLLSVTAKTTVGFRRETETVLKVTVDLAITVTATSAKLSSSLSSLWDAHDSVCSSVSAANTHTNRADDVVISRIASSSSFYEDSDAF